MKQNEIITYEVENGLITFDTSSESIISADKTITKLVIPSEINGHPVRKINNAAFSGCNALEHIKIPEGITSVGYGAFMNCKNLRKVEIPKTLNKCDTLGYWFEGCSNLEEIILAEGVTRIPQVAFANIPSKVIVKHTKSEMTLGKSLFAKTAVRSDGFSGGSGTESDPYLISGSPDLLYLQYVFNKFGKDDGTCLLYHDKYYQLTQDIDLSGIDWIPIGRWEYATGKFATRSASVKIDGCGYSIYGLTIDRAKDSTDEMGDGSAGLFESLGRKSFIQNLHLKEVDIIGRWHVGGVASQTYGDIENCTVSGTISGFRNVGGIVGSTSVNPNNSWDEGITQNCINYATISGTTGVGGIIGYAGSVVQSCSNLGSISGQNEIGGIAGRGGSILRCANYGTVSGTLESIGGIVGYKTSLRYIDYCFNEGMVNGNSIVGGIAGCIRNDNIRYCYNVGEISGHMNIGGLIGYRDSSYNTRHTMVSCYNAGKIFGENASGSLIGAYNTDYNFYLSKCFYLENTYSVGIGYGSNSATTSAVPRNDFSTLHTRLGDAYKEDADGDNQGFPVLVDGTYIQIEEFPETFTETITEEFSYDDGKTRFMERVYFITRFSYSHDSKKKEIVVKVNVDCTSIKKPSINQVVEIYEAKTKAGPFTLLKLESFYDAGYGKRKIRIPSKTAHYRFVTRTVINEPNYVANTMNGTINACINRTAHKWRFDYRDPISDKSISAPRTDYVKGKLHERWEEPYKKNYEITYEALYGVNPDLDNPSMLCDVHHILPLSHGGDHSFDNLIHLLKLFHYFVTGWWNGY